MYDRGSTVLSSVGKIHLVGAVNNLKTSYSTQLKTLPNDNVGHLDHVLIVYSSMEHVTWKLPGPTVPATHGTW